MRRAACLLLLLGCAEPTSPEPPDWGTVFEATVEAGLSDDAILAGIFNSPTVQHFDLRIRPVDVQALRDNPGGWVRADFEWEGYELKDVGVRLKGNGSFQPIDEKPSLKIEFDKFVFAQDFFGQDMLVLNNMSSDPSHLREYLAYTLYREAGVPAVRASHSSLAINGEYRGLYTHMEDVDERMLAHWFEDPNGPLYELFQTTWNYNALASVEHEDGPDDPTVIRDLAIALEAPREEAILLAEDHVNMDEFLSFYAVSGVVGQYDAWPFNVLSDDVHLYIDPTTQRIHFIPHGLDESQADPYRHVNIPGSSLLGQACYFTEACSEALAQRTWEVHAISEQIDLISLLDARYEVVASHGQEMGWPNDVLLLQFNSYLTLRDFWSLRGDRLTANLGPP